ncbi:MAG: DUF2779 domain-containing protein, partial [Anaerolineales bacterium]|nr:DUF2779 domain-containing protein [Anaerolineales bacterium]
LYVLEKAGLEVSRASIMHINRQCRYPDLSALFTLADVTGQAREQFPVIEANLPGMRRLQEQPPEPDIRIGRHCTRSYTCAFYDYCWQDVDGLTIYDIPRLKRDKEEQLEEADALYLSDIPAGVILTDTQQAFVDFINREQVTIDKAAIRAELERLEYPLYFFDFETIDYAIPKFEGCRPYDHVPFQYSCHVLHADGTLEHHEYLHTLPGDPRPGLVEKLLKDIGTTGSLVAYFAQFERLRLEELAEAFPEHAGRLLDLAGRLWDQLEIFRRYYRHYGFGKSNGLKSVLPVVVPELSYTDLVVQDGGQAQVAWEQMIATEDPERKKALYGQLLEYCALDTLAMVRMQEVLQEI